MKTPKMDKLEPLWIPIDDASAEVHNFGLIFSKLKKTVNRTPRIMFRVTVNSNGEFYFHIFTQYTRILEQNSNVWYISKVYICQLRIRNLGSKLYMCTASSSDFLFPKINSWFFIKVFRKKENHSSDSTLTVQLLKRPRTISGYSTRTTMEFSGINHKYK